MSVLGVAVFLALLPLRARAGTDGVGAAGGDAASLAANPAAAAKAGGTELFASGTANFVSISYQRAQDPALGSAGNFSKENAYVFGVDPYLAVRSDQWWRPDFAELPRARASRLAFGMSLNVPSGSSITFPANGGGRYSIITGSSFNAYLTPVVAYRVTKSLRVGFGPSLVISRISIVKDIDLAPSLTALLGPPPVPPEQAGTEGQIKVPLALGLGGTWTAGALYDLGDDFTFGIGYVAPTNVTMRGQSAFQPSLDFAVVADGDFAITKHLPPYLNFGVRYHVDPQVDFYLEGQWIGWSSNKYSHVVITNSTLQGTNANVSALLNTLGLTQSQFTSGILNQNEQSVNGDVDAGNLVGGVEASSGPWKGRFETGYFLSSVPSDYMMPAEEDYDTVLLGIGVIWSPPGTGFRVGLTFQEYLTGGRVITNSAFSDSASQSSGLALPSGNGIYRATISRAIVSTGYRF